MTIREQSDYVRAARESIIGSHQSCQYKKDHDPGDLGCLLHFLGEPWADAKRIQLLLEIPERLAEGLGESEYLHATNAGLLIQFPFAAQIEIVKLYGEHVSKRDLRRLLDRTKAERTAFYVASNRKTREQEEANLVKKLSQIQLGVVHLPRRGSKITKPLPKVLTRDETILAFFEYLTFDVAKEAWKLQMAKLHPDNGGEATEAASFNELWGRMKKLYGKD
jgi:hypothetical protein